MEEIQEINPNNNDEHDHVQDEPSSSSSSPPPGTGSPSDSAAPTRTMAATWNANHYLNLFNNDMDELCIQVDDISSLVTESDGSTLLHIAASVGEVNFIDSIVQQKADLLDRVRNFKSDLPVHAAARACQLEAVERLVSKAEELGRTSMLEAQNEEDNISMLEAKNEDGNTALHIALENHQQEMATFLFKRGANTCERPNLQGFSPLYLAIKAQFWDLVTGMLGAEAEDEAEAHLVKGKSVVHAAIVAHRKEILEKMHRKYGHELMYKTRDEMGRTPLSYAAYIGFLDWVNYMIEDKGLRNQVYAIDKNGLFPIHWACKGGNMEVLKQFFCIFKESTRWLLNCKGQSILHVAAESGKAEVVKYILQQPQLKTMINMKDEDGNTPFHLASKEKHPRVVYLFTWDDRVILTVQNKQGFTALDIAEEYGDVPSFEERLTWLFLRCAVPRAPQLHYLNIGGVNEAEVNDNASRTILVAEKKHPQILMKRKNEYKERINTLLVVSILVATVTFTSGFTVPGGYKNEGPGEGMATLAHKCFFHVFVITNTIALHSSILASVTLVWAHLDDLRLTALSLQLALPLLGTALAMMSVAFTAALYVVLDDVIFWLGIVVLVMGGLSLITLLIFFIPLYSPTSYIRNSLLRYVFHVPFTLMLLACERGKGRVTHCY